MTAAGVTMRSFRAVLKGIETFRAIRRADLDAGEPGVLKEIRFVRSSLDEGKTTA